MDIVTHVSANYSESRTHRLLKGVKIMNTTVVHHENIRCFLPNNHGEAAHSELKAND